MDFEVISNPNPPKKPREQSELDRAFAALASEICQALRGEHGEDVRDRALEDLAMRFVTALEGPDAHQIQMPNFKPEPDHPDEPINMIISGALQITSALLLLPGGFTAKTYQDGLKQLLRGNEMMNQKLRTGRWPPKAK